MNEEVLNAFWCIFLYIWFHVTDHSANISLFFKIPSPALMIACMQQLSLACNIQSLFQPLNKKDDLNLKLFYFRPRFECFNFLFLSRLLFFLWAIFLHYIFFSCFCVEIEDRDSYTSKGHRKTDTYFLFVSFFTKYMLM